MVLERSCRCRVVRVFVNDGAGNFTNKLYTNAPNDQVYRKYQGLVFQARYNIRNNWTLSGSDTVQLQNFGDYEGEGTNTPGSTSPIGNYPEAFSVARDYPFGNLQNFERNRARVWSIYTWQMGSKGDLSVSGLVRLDSGLAYSLVARNVALTPTQVSILSSAGYPDQPGPQLLFFTGARGDQTFNGYGLLDMSVNYDVPIMRTVKPWVKLDMYNLLNNEKLIAYSTTITPDKTSPLDSLGLPTGFTKGSTFGTATGNTVTNGNIGNINAFPLAFSGAQAGGRTFRVAVGFRF